MNAGGLRTKLGTGDTACLGVHMDVGDHCALVRKSGLGTMTLEDGIKRDAWGTVKTVKGKERRVDFLGRGGFCSEVFKRNRNVSLRKKTGGD